MAYVVATEPAGERLRPIGIERGQRPPGESTSAAGYSREEKESTMILLKRAAVD